MQIWLILLKMRGGWLNIVYAVSFPLITFESDKASTLTYFEQNSSLVQGEENNQSTLNNNPII